MMDGNEALVPGLVTYTPADGLNSGNSLRGARVFWSPWINSGLHDRELSMDDVIVRNESPFPAFTASLVKTLKPGSLPRR
jgi:hypothetical protein